MSIKPQDLRIGNWYLSVKFGIPVKCDLSDLYNLCANADGATDHPPIDQMFEPIALTEEWLLKCKQINYRYDKYIFMAGMVRYDIDINHKRYQAKDITIIAEYDNVQLAIAGINYVHQLQNLHFALTGEELTINP